MDQRPPNINKKTTISRGDERSLVLESKKLLPLKNTNCSQDIKKTLKKSSRISSRYHKNSSQALIDTRELFEESISQSKINKLPAERASYREKALRKLKDKSSTKTPLKDLKYSVREYSKRKASIPESLQTSKIEKNKSISHKESHLRRINFSGRLVDDKKISREKEHAGKYSEYDIREIKDEKHKASTHKHKKSHSRLEKIEDNEKAFSKSSIALAEHFDLKDFKFLFDKKLSNAEKLSMLKLKSKIGSKGTEEKSISKKSSEHTSHYVSSSCFGRKRSSLINNKTSEKSSNRGHFKRKSTANIDHGASSNNLRGKKELIECTNTPQKSSSRYGKSALQNSRNPMRSSKRSQNYEIPMAPTESKSRDPSGGKSSVLLIPSSRSKVTPEKKPNYTKLLENRLRNKRTSLPMNTGASKMAEELNLEMKMDQISMTPDISRKNSVVRNRGSKIHEDSQKELHSKKQDKTNYQEDLEAMNSKLIMNTLVSEAHQTFDNEETALQQEKRNLIEFIKIYTDRNDSFPKTSLQFYKILKLIGKGSFGKVHLGIHVLSQKKVAIKCIDKAYIKEERAQKKIVQEVKILRSLSHHNIIKILEVFENKKYVFIVTDYSSQGDLLKYMRENGVFREEEAKPIAAQMLAGLEFCHNRGVLHRDIKLDNILLSEDMQVKLCDFGVSRFMAKGEIVAERCGTPAYIAPEIINGKGYVDFTPDIWSLGVLLYAMTTGTIPFKANNIPDLHELILVSEFDFPKNAQLSYGFQDLIKYERE